MIRQPISRKLYLGLGIASVVVLLIAYTYLSHERHVANPDDTAIPSWGQLADGVVRASSERDWLSQDLQATFFRFFVGLTLSALGAVLLGLLMGVYVPVEALLLPPFTFLAKVPPTAMLPIFLVTVGDTIWGFTAIIAFGIVPTLAQSVFSAAKKDVPDELVYKAHTLGASQLECIWNVIFKHVLPKVIESIRLQVGPTMVYLIAAEALLADVGFGYRIRIQARLLDMSVVFFYLVVLAVAGYLIDLALIRLRKALCPWYSV